MGEFTAPFVWPDRAPNPSEPGASLCEHMFGEDADIRTLPTETLEAEIATLYSRISAETCRWLLLVAELDRREAHFTWGCRSCADWLSWHCGVGLRAAREQVRVARRLTELPGVRAAFARGELSYSKVRALTRAVQPGEEEHLLELALQTTAAQLERVVRSYRRALATEDPARLAERRFATFYWDDDGSLVVNARLAPEEGALVMNALEAAQAEIVRERSRESFEAERRSVHEPAPSARATKADAFARVAEAALAGGASGTRGSGGDTHQVVVHVDADALVAAEKAAGGGSPDGRGGTSRPRGELHSGPGLMPDTIRRICCDASLVASVERDGEALSVGRKTRSIPPAIRRALKARDAGCRFPGCSADRFIDAHHIQHWADGGETRLDNLLSLCRHHHRLLHEGGFGVLAKAGGTIVFRRPDGRRLEAAPRLRGANPHGRPCVPAAATPPDPFNRLAPCSAGENNERLDLDHTLFCLLQPSRGVPRNTTAVGGVRSESEPRAEPVGQPP